MNTLIEYLDKIENKLQQERMIKIDQWIQRNTPQLKLRIAWNQPMYVLDKTFIIAFSFSKNHISVAPETKALVKYAADIKKTGYSMSKKLFRILNDQEVNYELLKQIIEFNMLDKADYQKFWRDEEA